MNLHKAFTRQSLYFSYGIRMKCNLTGIKHLTCASNQFVFLSISLPAQAKIVRKPGAKCCWAPIYTWDLSDPTIVLDILTYL